MQKAGPRLHLIIRDSTPFGRIDLDTSGWRTIRPEYFTPNAAAFFTGGADARAVVCSFRAA
jgi:hypothetical protein